MQFFAPQIFVSIQAENYIRALKLPANKNTLYPRGFNIVSGHKSRSLQEDIRYLLRRCFLCRGDCPKHISARKRQIHHFTALFQFSVVLHQKHKTTGFFSQNASEKCFNGISGSHSIMFQTSRVLGYFFSFQLMWLNLDTT